MRKTNVFLEVDDRVYDAVVEPHKKAKTFAKLVASLLTGYIEDEYIRSYCDGCVEDMRKATIGDLDDALDSMASSLANIGLYTEELNMLGRKGMKTFSDAGSKKSEPTPEPHQQNAKKDAEVEALNREVESMRTQNEEIRNQNIEIMAMLNRILSGESSISATHATEPVEEPTVNAECSRVVEPVAEAMPTPEPVEEVEDDLSLGNVTDEEEGGESVDMSSLLSGIGFSF